jgi:hypothetical protein
VNWPGPPPTASRPRRPWPPTSSPPIASPPWPFHDDEDRPSGSVRPLSQAELHAILAHLSDDPDELLPGTGADRRVPPA